MKCLDKHGRIFFATPAMGHGCVQIRHLGENWNEDDFMSGKEWRGW